MRTKKVLNEIDATSSKLNVNQLVVWVENLNRAIKELENRNIATNIITKKLFEKWHDTIAEVKRLNKKLAKQKK